MALTSCYLLEASRFSSDTATGKPQHKRGKSQLRLDRRVIGGYRSSGTVEQGESFSAKDAHGGTASERREESLDLEPESAAGQLARGRGRKCLEVQAQLPADWDTSGDEHGLKSVVTN